MCNLDVETNKSAEFHGFYMSIHLFVATTVMYCDLNMIQSEREASI